MAHEIEVVNGMERFVSTQPAWHGLGTIVQEALTAAEAIHLAGLDTTASLQDMYVQSSAGWVTVPDKHAVVREDDNRVLGVVGNNYEIIQNRDCFDFMDSLIGEGQAVYETAGSLRGGSRLFLTVKLPEAMYIGPDKVEKYLLLSTSHDGSLALKVQWTPVRVVCANTLSVALGKKSTSSIAVRHTESYRDKITEARKVLQLTELYYARMEATFNQMLNTPLTTLRFSAVVDELFPKKEKDSTKAANDKKLILDLFHGGKGHENIQGTQWAAFNAITEFVDHHKTVIVQKGNDQNEIKMESAILTGGNGSRMKQNAFELIQAA